MSRRQPHWLVMGGFEPVVHQFCMRAMVKRCCHHATGTQCSEFSLEVGLSFTAVRFDELQDSCRSLRGGLVESWLEEVQRCLDCSRS
jgi:hypothetical protein